jgi:O-antigen biosynthesis protein
MPPATRVVGVRVDLRLLALHERASVPAGSLRSTALTAGTDLQPQHGAPRKPDDELVVRLDAPLPAQLAVGRGTAVFVSGHCFHRETRIASLALLVDGHEQAPMAWGMPRRDVLLEHGAGYRSGFWGMARIRGAPVDLGVRATLEGGRELTATFARVPPAEPVAPLSSAAPEVAICMATHDPPPELFRRQIESIRAQTHDDWLCVISDDCSSAERTAALEDVLAGDPRFLLSRFPRRLGFYRNFERALALAPAGARYVAMADQDDAWHPDKLATLLAAIGDARLVYSDARIVTGEGRLVSGT